jgi:hypothetical protein
VLKQSRSEQGSNSKQSEAVFGSIAARQETISVRNIFLLLMVLLLSLKG